jgi:hypothetical protein
MSTRAGRGHVLAGALLFLAQLGGGGTSFNSAVDQIERSVTRPVPQAPPAPVEPSPNVWVPDRFLPDPAQGGTSLVPGHWDRRLSDGQYYAPPSTACNSGTGACATAPAGVRPAPDSRTAPSDTLMAP